MRKPLLGKGGDHSGVLFCVLSRVVAVAVVSTPSKPGCNMSQTALSVRYVDLRLIVCRSC